jgi:hypothetical protein
MHTYMHACIRTYIHAYAYIRACIYTMDACMHTSMKLPHAPSWSTHAHIHEMPIRIHKMPQSSIHTQDKRLRCMHASMMGQIPQTTWMHPWWIRYRRPHAWVHPWWIRYRRLHACMHPWWMRCRRLHACITCTCAHPCIHPSIHAQAPHTMHAGMCMHTHIAATQKEEGSAAYWSVRELNYLYKPALICMKTHLLL